MINVEPCRGCGRTLFTHRVANLVVRLEIEPLDGPAAYRAIIDGRELWRATATGLSPAKPDTLTALATAEPGERPHIVQTHRCTAAGAPARPPVAPKVQPTPPGPPAGQQTPFSGPQATHSSAPSAANRRSEPAGAATPEPCCDGCGQPCADGTYTSVAVGDLIVWAQHVDTCPAA